MKMGSTSSFLSYNHLKIKQGRFKTGNTVDMATHHTEKMTITCSPILTLFFVSLLLYQLIKRDLSKRKRWKVMDNGASHLK